jgi:ABC-type phosphate transport system substrate-binding protein
MARRRTLLHRAGRAVAGLALGLAATAALAEVVAVVSANSPLAPMLDKGGVVDIFLGRTSRFPDGRRAVPIDQAEGSAARAEFYSRFAGKSPAQIKAHWSKIVFTGRGQPPHEVADTAELKRHLAEDPNAIGYLDQNMVDASLKVVLLP